MIERKKLISDCDGLALELTEMVPDDEKRKGIVQFAHGMAEHGRRYFPFMEYLSAKGYVCVIHDHRGHGGSVRSEEDLGYFYDLSGEYIVEDVHQVSVYIKNKYPGLPLVLFGHSMGSLVTRCYVKKYDGELAKVIFCGAPCNNKAVGVAILLTKIIGRVRGGNYHSRLIHQLAMGLYAKEFAEEGPSAWISSDAWQVKKYEEDEGCGFMFTVNGYRNLFLLLRNAYADHNWKLENPKLPVLFIAGEKDPVTGGKKKFQNTIDTLKEKGYECVAAKVYEGKRHELLNEVNRQQVFEDVSRWIEEGVLP